MLVLVDLVCGDTYRQHIVFIRLCDLLEVVFSRKRDGAVAGEHDVGCPFHHAPGDADRVHDTRDCRDSARFACRAIHDRCIEFDIAGRIGRRPLAGDIQAARLHLGDRKFDDVERAGPVLEPGLPCSCQLCEVLLCDRVIPTGDRPGAAMQC